MIHEVFVRYNRFTDTISSCFDCLAVMENILNRKEEFFSFFKKTCAG